MDKDCELGQIKVSQFIDGRQEYKRNNYLNE